MSRLYRDCELDPRYACVLTTPLPERIAFEANVWKLLKPLIEQKLAEGCPRIEVIQCLNDLLLTINLGFRGDDADAHFKWWLQKLEQQPEFGEADDYSL